MGLSELERTKFVSMLEQRGWILEEETIWSPDRGLWFSDSHFQDWTLDQFREIFAQRSERIEKAQVGDWERATQENRDASEVAQELLGRKNTQQ